MVHTLAKVITEDREIDSKAKARADCKAKGGLFDEATGTCKLPEPAPKPEPAPTPKTAPPTQPTIDPTRLSLADRQELADARARNAGIEPRLLEVGSSFSERVPGEIQTREEERVTELERQRQALIEEEKARIIAEETPERRSLDPATSALERFPVLGGTFGAIKDRLQEVVLATVPEGEFKEAFKDNLGVASPEELRTLALSEIERMEIEKGLTASEKFGALIEGIPVIGSLASKYAGGLIETPSENAAQVKTNLLKEKRRLASIETSVRLGLPVSTANEIVEDIENNVQKLESRLKLLISNSAELKFNSDLVNTYETEIISIRERAFQTKLNILSIVPATSGNEIQILEQLLILQEGSDLE